MRRLDSAYPSATMMVIAVCMVQLIRNVPFFCNHIRETQARLPRRPPPSRAQGTNQQLSLLPPNTSPSALCPPISLILQAFAWLRQVLVRANGASAGFERKDPDSVSVRIYTKSLLARAYHISLLGARAATSHKMSVVNLLYLIKNDTPGLKPQNDTQLLYLLATTILGNLAAVEVSSS